MKPSHSNAFREPGDAKSSNQVSKKLSSPSLCSMTAALRETNFGWSLTISPMRAFDVLRIWASLTKAPDACSLLYDVTLAEVKVDESSSSRLPQHSHAETSIGELADHLGIHVIDRFGPDQLVLDELSLRELIGMTNTEQLKCVLVEGPIEQRDTDAIVKTSKHDENPLAAEFRAVAALSVSNDRNITLETRSRALAVKLIAENFRHYLGAVRDRPFDEFNPPEAWQLDRLLETTGSLMVRPIETDVFSSSIDVGISTVSIGPDGDGQPSGPADTSLIYDLPSQTWHDEP